MVKIGSGVVPQARRRGEPVQKLERKSALLSIRAGSGCCVFEIHQTAFSQADPLGLSIKTTVGYLPEASPPCHALISSWPAFKEL